MFILKVLAVSIANFNADAWTTPELFQLVNPRAIAYYGITGILANFGLICGLDNYSRPNQIPVYWGFILCIIFWFFNDTVNLGFQILIFEACAALTCFLMFWVSLGTFVAGIASLAFRFILYIITLLMRWLYITQMLNCALSHIKTCVGPILIMIALAYAVIKLGMKAWNWYKKRRLAKQPVKRRARVPDKTRKHLTRTENFVE